VAAAAEVQSINVSPGGERARRLLGCQHWIVADFVGVTEEEIGRAAAAANAGEFRAVLLCVGETWGMWSPKVTMPVDL